MLLATHTGSVYVDLVGEDSADRFLRGSNVTFIDSVTAQPELLDSITLTVVDADGTSQYLLTEVSNPSIDNASNIYTVDSIDVTGFPSGDIDLTWTCTLDGYEYTSEQTIAFDTAPDMVFVEGMTSTISDSKCVFGQAKVFSVKVQDSLGNPVSEQGVRAKFYDKANGLVETKTAALVSAGSGVWNFTHTLSSGTYSAALNRYEIFWEVQLVAAGGWLEIRDSRVDLLIYGELSDATTGGISYTTNAALRLAFPDLDSVLSSITGKAADRELILNAARQEAAVLIGENVRNTKKQHNSELLKQLENYEVYRDVLMKAHGFAKFSIADGQLEYIDRKVKRIKNILFAGVGTIRIGPRA